MLRLMRDNAGSWIIKMLLAIIVIVFIFLGIGPGDTKHENIAATVNKKTISMDDYRQAYNGMVNMYRSQFGNNMNEDLIKMLGIKEKALESLIEGELIMQEADRLKISAADEELARMLNTIPIFQDNGKFSRANYENYLKYTRQSIDYFEMQQKKAIIERKFKSLLADSVQVTEPEAKEWFLWEKTEASIDYKLYIPSAYTEINPTTEELRSYYENNKENYKSNPQVKVDYLCFNPDDYKKNAEVTDEEISSYYNNNLSRYETEKTVDASHILIKADKNADAITVENARAKAEDIYKKATEEKLNFAQLARTYSEGPSSENGGSLGTFSRGKMVKEFSDKVFSMKEDEISEPVRTEFGWHIIRLEKINDATKKELAEVKDEITSLLIKEKSENLAYETSEDVFHSIVSGEELSEISEARNIKLIRTDMFAKDAGPLEIPASSRWDFTRSVFNMGMNEISDVLEFGGTYYIVQLSGKKEPEVMPFESVRKQIETTLKNELQDSVAKEEATKFLAELKNDNNKMLNDKEIKASGLFTRNASSSELNIDASVISEAFRLTEKNRFPAEPVKTPKGYYVIKLKERKKPELSGFERERERIEKELLDKKKASVVSNWLSLAKKASKIERNKRLLN